MAQPWPDWHKAEDRRTNKKPPHGGAALTANRRRLVVPRHHPTLRGLDGVDGALAGAAVFGGVEGNLLALDKPAHSSALQSGRVDEHVPGAVLRLDKAEAFLVVVEFHGARNHRVFLRKVGCTWAQRRARARP